MNTVKTKVDIEYTAYCTLNGQNVDSILEDICDVCHEGIEETSYIRQMIEEGGDEDIPNTVETWRDNAEYLESILCRILDMLGD
jgi:hypothetical protein